MLNKLQWEHLQHRRSKSKVIMLYKIIHQEIPIQHLLVTNTRVTRGTQANNIRQTSTRVNVYKFSFVSSTIIWRVILQSHYQNRRSADGRRAKFSKIGRRRPNVGRRQHRFWLNFWSADDFFVEAPKLKVSLTDPPIFMGFVIGEASGDGRPMIGRQSADVLKKFTSWYRPKVARSSCVNRPTITRRSVDEFLSKNRRQTDADIGRHSADGRPTAGRS